MAVDLERYERLKRRLGHVGVTVGSLAAELGCTEKNVENVLIGRRRSKRVDEQVARKLAMRVQGLFPDRYDGHGRPRRRVLPRPTSTPEAEPVAEATA